MKETDNNATIANRTKTNTFIYLRCAVIVCSYSLSRILFEKYMASIYLQKDATK